MSTQLVHDPSAATNSPVAIRPVPLSAPFTWLRDGWRDFAAAPGPSLLYGALFALASLAMVGLTLQLPWFTLAFLTGLLMMGPFLAVGLYTAARQREAGEAVSIPAALGLLRARAANLSLFAVLLGLIMAAWVRLSALLFAVQFSLFSPSIEGYLRLLGGGGDPSVWAYFLLIGFALAGLVFLTSAVAIPLILDRDVNPITAMHTSARAVLANWPAMVLWAGLIVALSLVGIATLFVGMLVLFPLLGYATWHSYRRLVG